MTLLRQLHAAGNMLVLITHDNEIAAQAPRRIRLFDGRVIEDTAASGMKPIHASAGDPQMHAAAGAPRMPYQAERRRK